jgi:hypothetical protein
VRKIAMLLAAVVLLSGQSPPPTAVIRHLVYQFGYNTPVASSGNGTGTTAIDIGGPAPDGGLLVSGTDHWWNTVRARATNTCELYKDGDVKCVQAPNAISPIQVTIFPMLARSYFHGLNAGATSEWSHAYHIFAAILPGASGFAAQPETWNCSYDLQGKGPIKGAGPLVLIEGSGTLAQQGGKYLKGTSKVRIVYDPVAKIPGIVRDVRTHIPYRSAYSNDLIELKLTQDSGGHHG